MAPDGWRRAIDDGGELRHAGEVAELDVSLDGWPAGTRAICRREQPHPGAQLRLWDTDGWRHRVTLTNSTGDALVLELRQRRHARVENCIKAVRDSDLDRMPFRRFSANQAWLELVLAGADLLRGCVGCASRANSPEPNPRPCATGYCTPPPASCVERGG